MSETPDSMFLKVAVAKGLVTAELAKEVFHEAQTASRPASELLIERGVLTAYNVDLIAKDVVKASGPKIIAGFQVNSKLGQGGMGAVYRATQLSIGREVALKVMAPEVAKNKGFAERFLREAMAMGAINHPNVITCFDAGQDGKVLYMALELMTGGDADQLAKRNGGILPAVRACAIVRDCAAGLAAIHKSGLIHRDIKPANIFLGENGNAKLADLGLARHEDGDDQMTRTGTAMGTPAFMSPEQAQGVDDLDIRSDIYALGATLFALVTGQPPFAGASAYAIVAKVIHDPVPDPRSLNPNVPEQVVQVIRIAMHKDRRKRPQTPLELQQLLSRCHDDLLAAGLTESTVGALPASLTSHPTPHTQHGNFGGAGNSNRHHRTLNPSTTSTGRSWLVGGGIFAAVAVVAVVGISLTAHPARPAVEAPPIEPTSRPAIAPPTVAVAPKNTPPPKPVEKPVYRTLAPNDPWPEHEAWRTATLALSPDRQVAEVITALIQLNPGFDGRNQADMNPKERQVPSLALSAKGLTDLRPLRGLNELHGLALINSTPNERAPLYQLDVLRGMPLTSLHLAGTMVEDLTPLAGMPLVELDLGGCPVRDITPIISPGLRSLAFNTAQVRGGITELRALTAIETLGPSWDDRAKPETFWQRYDAGEMPGVEAKVVAVAKPEVQPLKPVEPTLGAPPEAPKSPPSPLAVDQLTIPETAAPKVRDLAKTFNDQTSKILASVAQRRKDAQKTPLKVITDDYNRAVQGSRKDPSLLAVALALSQAKAALERSAPTRDQAFSDPALPRPTATALGDWRALIETSDAQAADLAEERRQKALKDLEPFVADAASGASELITQLQGMVPTAPEPVAEVLPPPVPGLIWRLEPMMALPHDSVLRDLSGIHAPAKVVGELGETSFGKALRGDGRTTQITTSLKRALTAHTLMCWVNPTHSTLGGGIIGIQAPDGSRFESVMFFGGEPGFGVAGKRIMTTNKGGYNDGYWRHVTLVVDRAERTLYLDEKQIGSDQAAENMFPVGSELLVGKRNSGRDERHFAGCIDGVLLFDRALNKDEIRKVVRWQSQNGEQVRTSLREREWIQVPVANGDFTKVSGAGKPTEWQARGDGIAMPLDDANRYLHLDLAKVGQDARVLRQQIRLDPTWRAIRGQVRVRLTKAMESIPEVDDAMAGVAFILEDPVGNQPALRRVIDAQELPANGTWTEVVEHIGWPIPVGYTQVTIECTLRGYLGTIDLDDVKVSALVGKP